MNIRPEHERDFKEIYQLVKTAFESAKVSNGDEQNFVGRLRSGSGYVPDLALVAEENGRLIGHVMLTEGQLWQEGEGRTMLLLAPPVGGPGKQGQRHRNGPGERSPGPGQKQVV